MRPVRQILDELAEAGRTGSGDDALDAIARDYEVLPPDEQEAARLELGVGIGASPRDIATAVRDERG